MLKTAFLVLVVLVVAVGGGTASVWYMLKAREGVGAVTVGSWTAFPNIGTTDADPYSKARVAREGMLALGRAEGLAFVAQRDSGGERLLAECDYKIEGGVPAARFWTLYAADRADRVIPTGKARVPALQSYQLLRTGPDTVTIAVGPRPGSGNWLPVSGSGAMSLVLTFYDTPIASSTGVDDIEMPQILKVGCNA